MEAHPISFGFVVDGLNIEPTLYGVVTRVDGVLRPSLEFHADFTIRIIANIGQSAQVADSPNPSAVHVHGGKASNFAITVCSNHHLVSLPRSGWRMHIVTLEGTSQKDESSQ